MKDRALAGAGRPDQSQPLAGLHLERETVEHEGIGPRRIGKAHIVEGDLAAHGFGQRQRLLRRLDLRLDG